MRCCMRSIEPEVRGAFPAFAPLATSKLERRTRESTLSIFVQNSKIIIALAHFAVEKRIN